MTQPTKTLEFQTGNNIKEKSTIWCGSKKVATIEDCFDGEKLVIAYNAHEELLDGCKDALASIENTYGYDVKIAEYLKALIKKAEGK